MRNGQAELVLWAGEAQGHHPASLGFIFQHCGFGNSNKSHLHNFGFAAVAARGKAIFWALTSRYIPALRFHCFSFKKLSQVSFNVFFTSLAPGMCLILAVRGFEG